eukprot:TRINITY_DN1023_c0_g1_i1.p1 TRINITY_DN1023_c0_g1~~TRINITY_DN1023_c0_g1_i1.p1  ORF type:complete len:495 (-),score=116.69 TRINITY_DN1023_c0_g1_i1:47-1531(-)
MNLRASFELESTVEESEKIMSKIEASIDKAKNSEGAPAYSEQEAETVRKELDGFRKLFYSFLPQRGRVIDWNRINPPREGMVLPYNDLKPCPDEEAAALLDKLVVLKLNGGLGTSMGCTGPKSAIDVHTGYNFLDLNVKQIEYLNEKYRTKVQLTLMNSFNTHTMTRKMLQKYRNIEIESFNQSRYPRIYKESLMPVPKDVDDPLESWYPPGHGDVFPALANSGLLDKYIAEGKEFIFISNIDNLGATVDVQLLKQMADSDVEYIMEVTNKTRSDIKGGTLIDYDGKPKLLEIAQVPKGKEDEFKSIKKFKIFNTNNLWVRLTAIKKFLSKGGMEKLDIIINQKATSEGPVIQLERAVGAAMQHFEKACGVNVPRTRFLPVKDTSDLFIVQSNLYTLQSGRMVWNPARQFTTIPFVKLGDKFKSVSHYDARFKGKPDILELDHLTVSGDVTFGTGVTLKGTVIIVANQGCSINIPDGAILENKVVSGNLSILDH